jgi:hypothetical protein
MSGSSNSRKVLEWQRRMTRFEKTRRTVAGFCRDEGVSVPTFYQWRKKLAQRQQEREDAGGGASGFAPVRLVASAGVAVQLPGGTQLHIPTSDPEALQVVIQTVARVDADRMGGASC